MKKSKLAPIILCLVLATTLLMTACSSGGSHRQPLQQVRAEQELQGLPHHNGPHGSTLCIGG